MDSWCLIASFMPTGRSNFPREASSQSAAGRVRVRVRDSGSGQGHRRRSSGSMACMAMLVDGKKHGGAWEAARQLW